MKSSNNSAAAYLYLPATWLAALCAEAAAILALSVIPAVGGGVNSGIVAHGLAYITFSCTAGIFLQAKKQPHAILFGGLIAACFGGAIELMQYFIPYRACELKDFTVNSGAACIGMLAARYAGQVLFKQTTGR